MPRYFFHVIDGREIIDSVGTVLPSLGQARAEAIRTAGAILRDEGDEFWNGTEWHMNVTDARGQPVLKLRFSADTQGIVPEEDQKIRGSGIIRCQQAPCRETGLPKCAATKWSGLGQEPRFPAFQERPVCPFLGGHSVYFAEVPVVVVR